MDKITQCRCEQLSIEVSGPPIFSDHNNHSSLYPDDIRFTFFENDSVIGTRGEAECITINKPEQRINRYHCPDCKSAVFCVSIESPSLIGIALDQHIREQANGNTAHTNGLHVDHLHHFQALNNCGTDPDPKNTSFMQRS